MTKKAPGTEVGFIELGHMPRTIIRFDAEHYIVEQTDGEQMSAVIIPDFAIRAFILALEAVFNDVEARKNQG